MATPRGYTPGPGAAPLRRSRPWGRYITFATIPALGLVAYLMLKGCEKKEDKQTAPYDILLSPTTESMEVIKSNSATGDVTGASFWMRFSYKDREGKTRYAAIKWEDIDTAYLYGLKENLSHHSKALVSSRKVSDKLREQLGVDAGTGIEVMYVGNEPMFVVRQPSLVQLCEANEYDVWDSPIGRGTIGNHKVTGPR